MSNLGPQGPPASVTGARPAVEALGPRRGPSPAGPERCSCRRAGWRGSSDAGPPHSHGRRGRAGRPCYHWNASSGSGNERRVAGAAGATTEAAGHSPPPGRAQDSAGLPPGPTALRTHAEGRTLGGRVLPEVRAVDAVPLDKLVGRRVRPEVVGGLHLGVLQGAGPHCRADGAGSPSPRGVLPPSSHQKDRPLQQLGYPRLLPKRDQRRSLKARGREQF